MNRIDSDLLVVGDLNGNLELLQKIIEVAKDKILVLLGDVLGKENAQEIHTLYQKKNVFIIKGNQDQKLINHNMISPYWNVLPTFITFVFPNQNKVSVVHGGISPKHKWKDIYSQELIYIRTLDGNNNPVPLKWNNNKLEPIRPGVSWHQKYDGRFGYVISSHGTEESGIKHYLHSCSVNSRYHKTGKLLGQIVLSNGTLGDCIQICNI